MRKNNSLFWFWLFCSHLFMLILTLEYLEYSCQRKHYFLPKHKMYSRTAMITFSTSLYHERLANSNITFQNEEINLFPDNWNLLGWEKKITAFEGRFHSTWCFRAFVLLCLNHIFIKSKRIVWSLIIIKLKSDKKSIRILMFHDNIFREEKGVKYAY